jgi:hypothetical protein
MDEGVQISLGFFAVGILWLFIAQWLLAIISFLRQLLG